MERLFTTPYHLVGQQHANKKILTALWGKLCSTEQIDPEQPLVFIFAGPSGHGKTELAKNLGHLLNSVPCEIDCVRTKLDTKKGNFQGHIHLELDNDSKLCKKLAKDSYFATGEARNPGARCIGGEVNNRLKPLMDEKWFEAPEPSTDAMNNEPYVVFKAGVQKVGQHGEMLRVIIDGEIEAPRPQPS